MFFSTIVVVNRDEYIAVWCTGDYEIMFTYFGEPVLCGKAFTPKAWDANAIKVTGIKPATVCKPSTFNGMLSSLLYHKCRVRFLAFDNMI